MASTLTLQYDRNTTYTLWAWNPDTSPHFPQLARIIGRIQNHVYTAYIGPLNVAPAHTVVAKIARDNEVLDLEKEADFYENELFHLQGTVVPRYFGYFRGRSSRGTPIGCMLLEYCTGGIDRDPAEYGRRVMLASCQIHRAGLVHGDLLDGRHIVKSGHEVRIIDFSRAFRHDCRNAIPTLNGSNAHQLSFGCKELINLEQTYGALDCVKPYRHAAISSRTPLIY